jgi:hypothetical protein
MPRAKEIAEKMKMRTQEQELPLSELRKLFGAHLSDEEFLLRYMMKGYAGDRRHAREPRKRTHSKHFPASTLPSWI